MLTRQNGDSGRDQMQRIRFPLAAGLVHAFTASGSVCALLATLAVWQGRIDTMFLWLGLAFIIDGFDGTFARAARVGDRLPRFSGEVLDLVVDYLTYVFVPALALLAANRLLAGWPALALASAVLLSSLYHFSDTGSKDDDYHFVGFPAVWNIVAFYVFALDLSQAVASLLVVLCAGLTFVPWAWVHPLRVTELRPLTLLVTGVWALAAFWATLRGLPAGGPGKAALLAGAVYVVGLSLWWRFRSRAR